jgi:hypothetical protein
LNVESFNSRINQAEQRTEELEETGFETISGAKELNEKTL